MSQLQSTCGEIQQALLNHREDWIKPQNKEMTTPHDVYCH